MLKYSLLSLLSLFLSNQAYAWDHDTEIHFAAHAGTSFALDTILYGVNNKAFGINKKDAKTLAFFETLVVGLAYKLLEKDHTNLNQAMIENLVGASAATVTVTVFEW